MVENANPSIRIDLNEFKLRIDLKKETKLTLHFNSPSRMFYLSVIALVVHEMKKLGKITSISLERHLEVLALLNESVGGSVGSSDKKNLLQRIYRKWKDALPNLEEAPLYKVLGRRKGYDEGIGRTYAFTESERDNWANLFEYKGSKENVRLKFSIDAIGVSLDEVIILYEDAVDGDAWERFLSSLKGQVKSTSRLVAVPLPDKPSIAVLPFINMSEDSKQEFFSDGLTEEIITALGNVPQLLVIARNSTFAYKGKPVKVQQVSEELGVRYVLEGSVRKDENNIRIAAQLIDALTGNHLWAERYDRNLKDIFAVQDEITKKIITSIQVKLTMGEQVKAFSRGTTNLEAYLKFLQAQDLLHQYNPESNALAKQLAEECIDLDPAYSRGYGVLSAIHQADCWLGTSKSPKDSIKKSMELAQRAIILDETNAVVHALLGMAFSMIGQHDKAVAAGKKAVAINPVAS